MNLIETEGFHKRRSVSFIFLCSKKPLGNREASPGTVIVFGAVLCLQLSGFFSLFVSPSDLIFPVLVVF